MSSTAENSIDILALLRGLPEDVQQYEINCFMGSKHRIPIRMLFQRLPQDVVEERRRKARKRARKKGRQYSQDYMDMLAWETYVTNVPANMLFFEQVFTLYRIRWQIELTFKLWKSQAKLAVIGGWRSERVFCQLYVHLIILVLFHWFISPYRIIGRHELSPPKAFQVLQDHASLLFNSIINKWYSISSILTQMEQDFCHFALKNKRRKNPSTYQLLEGLNA